MGDMVLSDVKPMHCQLVLDKMVKDYRQSTVEQTRITLGVLFRSAVDNEIISSHPLKDNVRSISKKESKKRCIPLIGEAVDILLKQKKKNSVLKVVSLEYSEFVFLNRNAEPTKNSAYDTCLQKLCVKNDI